MDLKAFFEAHPRVAIAFSGGVDSTYLVTAAAQYAQSVHAYTIDSAFVPRFELEGAKALTKKIGITHSLLPDSHIHVPPCLSLSEAYAPAGQK